MIDSAALLVDLRAQLKVLTVDLRAQAEDPTVGWARQLQAQFAEATSRERTGLSWVDWRDGEVDQAAVAWLVACAFVRFCEDNHLLDGARDTTGRPVAVPWIAGPTEDGNRLARAVENETMFYRSQPTANSRDWLHHAFRVLADLPAGRLLVDRHHNPVWTALISAEAAQQLVEFWRATDAAGALVHDFTDPGLDTRFLGDLYQELSEFAQKKYALLQTPVFVEELILDLTLTPAIEEFGLEGLKLIDPTCGSGHFLLGAFARLDVLWRQHAPGMEARTRVQKSLDSIHGVDLNPFAVAIARFRLTVAALKASRETSLVTAPGYAYHLAIGDSLLASQGQQGEFSFDEEDQFTYAGEDVAEYQHILEEGTYHVVVGNPPYITVKDKALNQQYRAAYSTCHRQYALSVPFMELFFRLAQRATPARGAGFVGQITSNSFMKREFGTKLIENLLSGADYANPVDLTHVLDTSGAYIPGHGTPTVILIGKRRRPTGETVRAVLGKRGEPGQPADAAKGLVWTEIVTHLDQPGFDGTYVTITDLDRDVLSSHPWSLAGGGASSLKSALDAHPHRFADTITRVGFFGDSHADEAFFFARRPALLAGSKVLRKATRGELVRDWSASFAEDVIFPYDVQHRILDLEGLDSNARDMLWPLRTELWSRRVFSGATYREAGQRFFAWHQLPAPGADLSITFAFVATHNHFVLDRGGKVFNRSAPVIKLPADATDDDHLDLLGVLNSSTACFWLKQVSHNKGEGGGARVDAGYSAMGAEEWRNTFEFTGTKLQEFPLPSGFPRERARTLDALAQELSAAAPAASVAAILGGSDAELTQKVDAARERWEHLRRQMIFEQEELDWEVYRLYGLVEEDLTYQGDLTELALGERAFEIVLARAVESGAEETAWFDRHGSIPITEVPGSWPADYRELVERRLELIESDPFINLLERPEYKRRWQTDGWDAQLREALEDFILDRLEDPGWWRDAHDVVAWSVAQLSDLVRHDEPAMRAITLLTGTRDADVPAVISKLMTGEAVPFLAAHRYSPSGLEKRGEWERAWDLQRKEDAEAEKPEGERKKVSIPVPPKYGPKDFRSTAIWQARGKLDVPKERFISYPDVHLENDPTGVFGWAGWDHRDQAIALARLVQTASDEVRVPLLAGLVELEPWLHQWHAEPDSRTGASPAETITAMLDGQAYELGMTRADLRAWRPPAPTRGRRRKS